MYMVFAQPGVPTEVAVLAAAWSQIRTSISEQSILEVGTGRCIASTRFGIGVLGVLGIKSRALPCSLTVWNGLAYDLSTRNVPMVEWPALAWSLGVAADEKPIGRVWDAHLCIEWKGENGQSGILDLDLPLYTRPQYGINLMATALAWPDRERRMLHSESDSGEHVLWVAARHLTRFRLSEEWTIPPDKEELNVAANTVKRLCTELADT